MSTPTEELLRGLLPRFYWLRDAERGGVLGPVLDAIAAQYDELRRAVEDLYDDLFIATCDPAIVPYIGEDVGVVGLSPLDGPGLSDRAWVGRIVGLRRTKGTLATAARGAAAATGWAAYAQDGRTVVARTQSLLDPQPGAPTLADVRDRPLPGDPDAPWSRVARGVAISDRPLPPGLPHAGGRSARPGYPAPATVAVSIWRLQSFPVVRRTARAVPGAPPHAAGRAFTFDPLGRDIRLFATPAGVGDRRAAPRPEELPLPLTVASLAAALSHDPPPVAVWRSEGGGPLQALAAGALRAGTLSDWRAPAGTVAEAVVDPLRGRLLFTEQAPDDVQVSYAYGFSGELGGGPYGIASNYAPPRAGADVLHVAASYSTIDAALALAQAPGPPADRVIVVDDSATYRAAGEVWSVALPAGRELRIASAPEAAPVLEGDVRVRIGQRARLELSGLTIAGSLTVEGEGELAIEHCTLAPGGARPSLVASGDLAITIGFAISGAVALGRRVQLTIRDGIVEGALDGPRTLEIERATVLGATTAATILARDCVFAGRVEAREPDRGIVRTSFLPAGSRPPLIAIDCAGDSDGAPRFTSTRWGDPGYCQLDLRGPRALATGGSLGRELGAFSWLAQPTRFERLPGVLDELLPAGLAASVEYRT